jgi:hypothetical protein
MAPEKILIPDLVNQLSAATEQGTLAWEVDDEDDKTFQAKLATGSVLLYRSVSFTPGWPQGPVVLELLDRNGRVVYEYRQKAPIDGTLDGLYELVRRKALDLDMNIAAILDDIKLRAAGKAN